ncbi:uncharacterized protein VP01_1967g4 [Puccinia sorghi]|uniref:Phosphoserine phosphatase n=1 Tax=Puccinia sorghi TaxID=27349 RepID=A0A0L6VCE6_9BASI|nr:uncharacterized protein VP01_1967g4 [Puccinia sorghi]
MSHSDLAHKDAKFIVFTFLFTRPGHSLGTITTEDSNDHITDNLGYGRERRREQNLAVLEAKLTFRDSFREMIESASAKHSFDECRETVKKKNLIGKEEADRMEIVANEVDTSKGSGPGEWTIKYRHPESALSPRPTIFFCGDGVSDLSAARSADCLFVKLKEGTGNDLAKHCESEGIKHVKFHSFHEVKNTVQSVVEGKTKVEDVFK